MRGLTAFVASLVLAGCAGAPRESTGPGAGTAPPPAPVGADATAQDFAAWTTAFRARARQAGIDEATLHAAFDGAQYRPLVVQADRSQAEFTRSIWSYLDRAVSPGRIARGQDMLRQYRAEADAAAARYGMPAEILVAVWGMESDYGRHYGDIPTIDALATLGFDGRRADWAQAELMAALRILQRGDIDREHMLGSWAGAMGQTQFLPSSFLAYAVDADGDGRRDIWGSLPDVLASTAHFLQRSGWQPGQPWGLEVRLPPGFDLARADRGLRQSASQWAAEGVSEVNGDTLATTALSDASILLPAGARGPAFLVGPNFRAILRYNSSDSYALAVGLLAQQIAGGPGVQAEWPRDQTPLTRDEMRALQQALNRLGFDSGVPDGLIGPATRSAVRAFQLSIGLPADGHPDTELLRRATAP